MRTLVQLLKRSVSTAARGAARTTARAPACPGAPGAAPPPPRRPTPTEPVLDAALGSAVAAQIRDLLQIGAFDRAQGALETVTDPDDRAFVVEAAARWRGYPTWLDQWIKAMPESPGAFLIRGAHALHWAAEATAPASPAGADGAGQSADDANSPVRKRLELAEANLKAAAKLGGADPTPAVFLIRSATLLGLGADEVHDRFEVVRNVAPHHHMAHSFVMQSLGPLHGGTHERMQSFVAEAVTLAPQGSELHTLVAEAHLERYLDLLVTEGEEASRAAMRAPGVLAALYVASAACFSAAEFRPRAATPRSRGYFAACFWLAGDHECARMHFDAIGPWVSEQPWASLGEAVTTFNRARGECLLSAAPVRAVGVAA
jgi:hypothetical protein